MTDLSPSVLSLAETAFEAGRIIMKHYAEGALAKRTKEDASPVTAADEEAEKLILLRLKEIAPLVPVIAEEEVSAGRTAHIGAHFFLVDPLDGTKEFLNRNGEFTVNIAEVMNGKPVRGIVYIPAKQKLFAGETERGAFEIGLLEGRLDWAGARRITVRKPDADGLVVVASRSHRDYKTEEFLANYKVKDFKAAGSSLKFCLIAAGEADLYPRLSRTMEWDTAAGHAVLAAAGGSVTTIDGRPFIYGKVEEKFANPFFLARGAS